MRRIGFLAFGVALVVIGLTRATSASWTTAAATQVMAMSGGNTFAYFFSATKLAASSYLAVFDAEYYGTYNTPGDSTAAKYATSGTSSNAFGTRTYNSDLLITRSSGSAGPTANGTAATYSEYMNGGSSNPQFFRQGIYWLAVRAMETPTKEEGCFVDDASYRHLPVQIGTASDSATNSIDGCVAAARAQGYAYAGLQYYGYCFAGNHLNGTHSSGRSHYPQVASAECTSSGSGATACTGNSGQMCGAASRNRIYSTAQYHHYLMFATLDPDSNAFTQNMSYYQNDPSQTSNSSWYTTESPSGYGAALVNKPMIQARPVNADDRLAYQGCFTEDTRLGPYRALPKQIGDMFATTNTHEACVQAARTKGFLYAGLQYYGYCFGGNRLALTATSGSECNTPCQGNSSQTCGGGYRNSIYATGLMVSEFGNADPENTAGLIGSMTSTDTSGDNQYFFYTDCDATNWTADFNNYGSVQCQAKLWRRTIDQAMVNFGARQLVADLGTQTGPQYMRVNYYPDAPSAKRWVVLHFCATSPSSAPDICLRTFSDLVSTQLASNTFQFTNATSTYMSDYGLGVNTEFSSTTIGQFGVRQNRWGQHITDDDGQVVVYFPAGSFWNAPIYAKKVTIY
jgi:hypothetical protein